MVPLETSVNITLMSGVRPDGDTTVLGNSFNEASYENGDSLIESNSYNNVFSLEDNVRTYIPEPNPLLVVNKWENRFAASDVKINGELIDSWTQFPIEDIWDADGINGGINAITLHNTQMFFWQDKACGYMQI